MNLTEIKELIPKCCNTDVINIDKCYDKEYKALKEFLPTVKSILVLAHHIKDSKEWVWNQLKSETETCTADLHTKNVLKKINEKLNFNVFFNELSDNLNKLGTKYQDDKLNVVNLNNVNIDNLIPGEVNENAGKAAVEFVLKGIDYKEVSQIMGVNYPTVRRVVHQARSINIDE